MAPRMTFKNNIGQIIFFQGWKVSYAFSCHLEQDLNSLLGYGALPLPTPSVWFATTPSLTPSILFLEEEPSNPQDPHLYFPLTRILSLASHRADSLTSHLCPGTILSKKLFTYPEIHSSHPSTLSLQLPFLTDRSSQSLPLSDTHSFTCLRTVCLLKPKEEGFIVIIAETPMPKTVLARHT